IERKTDLIIQITPRIIVDEYSGIVKSEEMIKYEKYVTKNSSIKDYNETQDLDSEQSEVE
ncbi:hypothetical protein N9T87_00960, partial [bacterium]|nr:hypothetical protein [bacterium]